MHTAQPEVAAVSVTEAAAQLIADASSKLDKQSASATESPLATVSIPESQNAQQGDRWHVMLCIRACAGDHTAGLMLSQLLYWWPKKRPNHRGVKKSVSDWEAELMLGEKPVKRINAKLTALGFVEIYQDQWGYFKSSSTFYVLTPKALALLKAPLPAGELAKASLPKAPLPTGGMVAKAPLPTGEVTENTKSFTEKEETKPVVGKTTTPVSPESSMQTGKGNPKVKPLPDALKKVPKFSKLGTVFDETKAKNYPTNLKAPKGQKDFAYANLSHVKDRMQAVGYSFEAVIRFVEYMAGDGWGIVRAQWTPEFNPQIGAKEKAPIHPDLAWLVGSAKYGTGMHRLEIALDVWHMDGEPRPGETKPSEPQEQPTTPLVKLVTPDDLILAKVAAMSEPVDTRLSVADAWELIERASARIPLIEMWRDRIADGVPTPDLAEFLADPAFVAEKLEIALLLMPSMGLTPEPAPEPEPEPVTVECPKVVLADPVTPVHIDYDDYICEACDEAPEYVAPDVFDHHKAEQARQKAMLTKNKPNMFQHGKFKFVKHALAH